MLAYEWLPEDGIVMVMPSDALEAKDFEDLAASVDPLIEERGSLQGLVIVAESFPGWENFQGLLAHLRFVREHHQHIKKVAAVTDNGFLSIMPAVANHFVNAQVKHFEFSDQAAALAWVRTPDDAEG